MELKIRSGTILTANGDSYGEGWWLIGNVYTSGRLYMYVANKQPELQHRYGETYYDAADGGTIIPFLWRGSLNELFGINGIPGDIGTFYARLG